MSFKRPACLIVFSVLLSPVAFGTGAVVAPTLTIGRNLATHATVSLGGPAPGEGLQITISSEDGALLMSKRPDVPGTASLVLDIKPGMRESPEFWVQAVGDIGSTTYTVKGSAFGSVQGTVEITPSAIIIMGPLRAPTFRTTPRASASRIMLYSVRLDSSLNYVEQQIVAAGLNTSVEIETSDPEVGSLSASTVAIAAGTAAAAVDFVPAKAGTTVLSAGVPPGFTRPADNKSITALVVAPGMSITEDIPVGQHLQLGGVVGLGEPAPEGGLTVTLTSSDESRLLLSAKATQVGSKTLDLKIPAGEARASFFLQAVANSGNVSYTATAPGYQSRTATIPLAPSGLVIALKGYGPPDEAELFRKDEVHPPRGLVATLSKPSKIHVAVWTVQLDPETRRSADITVQPLGPRAPLKVIIESSNPAVGKISSTATIAPGSEVALADFVPLTAGTTVVSVVTPEGFTESSNSTSFPVSVRP